MSSRRPFTVHALRRRIALGLPAAWALGTTAARAAAPRALTVAAFPAIDQIVRGAVPAWRELHPDVELKVVSRRASDHHVAMTTALSSQSNLPDLFALEADYVGRFSLGSGLEDLRRAPFNIEALRQRFVPYAYQQATNPRGEVVAVPTDVGPGTLLYRSDLLQRAGLVEADLVRSWDGFVEAGRRIKASTGAVLLAHARDMKDILIRAGVTPGDGIYFGRGNTVRVNSPHYARAFELARAVRKAKLDANIGSWSSDWTEGFRRGGIATQMMGAWLAGHLNNWLAPGTRGLWRAAQLPEGAYAAYGGTFFALPRAADPAGKALAWELATLLTTDRRLQLAAFQQHDAFPAAVDTYGDPFFEQPIPFLGGQPARTVWREAARRITAPTVHKQDRFAEEVINTELDKVLLRGKDIPTALGDAERLLKQRALR
ncbi:carbohydrate ABC transporter substrate-binding protein [Aquincola sp. S2]|uniref:Carbohydrate ABC transporter substrate-binding protein n=1 Tax=Pseudaquabacterium terrae TaxID=2732868 RepID=A0ABX2EAI6_9BURK|nr:ABC transporter substrate-binding protein [Aquabacterium terrae]NRF65767.1 carbohydrate ABC transporter substrate-binding protein [Aquabacterium terrae]